MSIARFVFIFPMLVVTAAAVLADPPAKWELQTSGVTDHLHDVVFLDETTGCVVGANSTILRTSDGGKSWKRVVDRNARGPHLDELTFADAKTGWAKTKILNNLLHTTDGGLTWRNVPLPVDQDKGKSFCKHGAVGTTYFLQYSGSVFRTSDVGRTWARLTKDFPNDSQNVGRMWFADAEHGCIAWDGGRVAMSADGGKTWHKQQLAKDDAFGNYTYTQFADANSGWALPNFGTIHRTADGGRTWQAHSLGHDRTHHLLDLHFADAKLGHVLTWGNNNIGEVRRTTDGGQTWQLLGKLHNPSNVRAVSFPDADHGWVVGDKGYVEHYRKAEK